MSDFIQLDHSDVPHLYSCSPDELPSAIEDEIKKNINRPTNIVVFGQYGAGKSSLIHALSNEVIVDAVCSIDNRCNLNSNKRRYADKRKYGIVFWDTDGYGINATKEELGLRRWDFADIYIVVSSTSRPISRADISVITHAQQSGKTLIVVHTKIDEDITKFRSECSYQYNDRKYVEMLRDMLQGSMESQGIYDVPLFLLSSKYTRVWDFRELRQKLDDDLKDMKNQSIYAYLIRKIRKRMKIQKRLLETDIEVVAKNTVIQCLKAKPMSYSSAFIKILTEKKDVFEKELGVKYPSDIILMVMEKQKLFAPLDLLRCVPLLGTVPFCIKIHNAMTEAVTNLLNDGVEFAEQKWFAVVEEIMQRYSDPK